MKRLVIAMSVSLMVGCSAKALKVSQTPPQYLVPDVITVTSGSMQYPVQVNRIVDQAGANDYATTYIRQGLIQQQAAKDAELKAKADAESKAKDDQIAALVTSRDREIAARDAKIAALAISVEALRAALASATIVHESRKDREKPIKSFDPNAHISGTTMTGSGAASSHK